MKLKTLRLFYTWPYFFPIDGTYTSQIQEISLCTWTWRGVALKLHSRPKAKVSNPGVQSETLNLLRHENKSNRFEVFKQISFALIDLKLWK